MASIYVPGYNADISHASEYGNTWSKHFTADLAANQNDKIYLGKIPAGVKVSIVTRKNEACGSSVTLDLGFEPVSSDGPSAVVDRFIDGADVAAAGSGVYPLVPIKFEREVNLVATVLGANLSGTPRLDFVLMGDMEGVA